MKKFILITLLFALAFATNGYSVARNWVGLGSGGAGTDFNAAANWSPAGVPTAADALTMTINAGFNNIILLSGNITVGSLSVSVTGNRNGVLRANNFVLTVNGAATFNAVTYVSGINYSYCELDAGAAPGGFVFNGTTNIHTTGDGDTYIGGANVSEGSMTFNANVTIGAWAYTLPGDEPIWNFNGAGAQTFTFSSQYNVKPSSVRVGVTNSPTVTMTAVPAALAPGNWFTVYDGSLTVNNNAVLDLGDFDLDPWVAGCVIQLNNTATIRCGNDNNFPGFGVATVNPTNYTTYTISSTSTTHYNGGLAQSISNLAAPGYGHIMYSGAGAKTSAGSFSIRGDWTKNATTFNHNNSTHTFNGTPNQTIGGTSATIFYNLVENKASGSLLMGVNNNQVNNVLTLTAGPLNLNAFTLIVNNAALAAVARTAGYIISETNTAANASIVQWNMGATTGSFVFHFGTAAGVYIPFTFNKTTAGASNVSVSTRPTATSANTPFATGVTHMFSPNLGQDGSDEAVIDRWWHITSSGAATANLTFTYRGAENTMIAPYQTGNVGAQYWSSAWLPNNSNIGSAAAVTAGTGSVTANAVAFTAATFTPMVLSSTTAPLPVELVSTVGTCVNGFGELIWVTASETNNSHFDILRSDDGNAFRPVGTVHGFGTTSTMHEYKFTDREPLGNSTMYRLAQYDFNGDFKLYTPFTVEACETGNTSVHTYSSSEELVVTINSKDEGIYTVNLLDLQGRTISAQQFTAGEGASRFSMSKEGITPGIYLVMTTMPNGEVSSEKILVQ